MTGTGTYMVCDGNGNTITAGLSPWEAERIAQEIANRRGESVWLCASDDDGVGDEIEPEGDL